MNRWQQNQHIASVVGLIGGALGVVAGLIQATLGSHIPHWSGHKAAPVALGLLTILLSAISVLSAVALRSEVTPGRRLAAAAGLLVPGSLCFSTGGALWYLPGLLLFTGGVYAVIAGDAARTRQVVARMWWHLLVSVLGGFELLMAVSAGPTMTIAVGVLGGVALVVAPSLPAWRIRLVLLLIGTVPFAILTWWSVATPVLAVLALAIGLSTLRPRAPDEFGATETPVLMATEPSRGADSTRS
ncbi:hypothetical protein ABIB25_005344 [Nakamurella sp. UYEF19]|uniref:hypothetical protein n=1 Tax=Nakamurella sp. UYEF19 TaxID=1756392 RepID=UPI0033911B9D